MTSPPFVVNAVSGSGQVLAPAPVGTDGYFKFADLPANTPINFQLQLPPGWEGIVPEVRTGGLAAMSPTSLPESNTCYRIVFKIRRPTGIIVIKWEEQLDGTVVPGEDWTITAMPQIVTTTNGLGQYEFSQAALKTAGLGFPGASVRVCEEKRAHWIAKSPECSTIKFPYPVPPAYTGAKIDFTNAQDPP